MEESTHRELESYIITDLFTFANPHTKAYLHEIEEISLFSEDYFVEVFVMIPSSDEDILQVMKYVFDERLGIKYTLALQVRLKECLNGDSSFEWTDSSTFSELTVVCGDRGQGTYFRIYDDTI